MICFTTVAIIVGGRGEEVGTDTENYVRLFQRTVACDCVPDTVEPLFGLTTIVAASIGNDGAIFLTIVSMIQLTAALRVATVLRRMIGYETNDVRFISLFLALLFCSPFFMAGQINVLRQGISAFFVVLSILAFFERRFFHSVGWIIVALGFHSSALLYLGAFPLLLARFAFRRAFFVIFVGMYATGMSQILVRTFSDITGLPLYALVADYGSASDYTSGVRFDFLLFALAPFAVSQLLGPVAIHAANKERLRMLLDIYAVLLIPFLLFGWAAFSDRFAFGAWNLLPAIFALYIVRITQRRAFLLPMFILLAGALYFVNAVGDGL